jgi:hypothetical protein
MAVAERELGYSKLELVFRINFAQWGILFNRERATRRGRSGSWKVAPLHTREIESYFWANPLTSHHKHYTLHNTKSILKTTLPYTQVGFEPGSSALQADAMTNAPQWAISLVFFICE